MADLVANAGIGSVVDILDVGGTQLNPEARTFKVRNLAIVYGGRCIPDVAEDWQLVSEAFEGVTSGLDKVDVTSWGTTVERAAIIVHRVDEPEPDPLPSASDVGFKIPAKPVAKVSQLSDKRVTLPCGNFIDKNLPKPEVKLSLRVDFTPKFFHSLHNCVAAPGIRLDGSTYPAFTPNYLGARISLKHS